MELGGKATNRTSSKALATVSSNSIDLPVGSDPIIGTSRLWERRKLGNGIVARGCRAIGIDSCFTDRMIKVIGGKTGSALIESFSDATFKNGKIFGAMEKRKKKKGPSILLLYTGSTANTCTFGRPDEILLITISCEQGGLET